MSAVLSPHLTVEEAYLLATYVKQIDPDAVLAVGPVPTAGEDESFPNGFTIRAEKCPNRKGVEAIVSHFGESLLTWDDFLIRLDQGGIDAVDVAVEIDVRYRLAIEPLKQPGIVLEHERRVDAVHLGRAVHVAERWAGAATLGPETHDGCVD